MTAGALYFAATASTWARGLSTCLFAIACTRPPASPQVEPLVSPPASAEGPTPDHSRAPALEGPPREAPFATNSANRDSSTLDVPTAPPDTAPLDRTGWEKGRAGDPERDYIVRVGIGFGEEEFSLLEQAVATWKNATGLPLTVRPGYGPTGDFHLVEESPVCGQRWVYDGYLGCYDVATDDVVLNRPGIELHRELSNDLLYIVLMHEIGHWLGLGHAAPGEDSIMQPDYPHLASRGRRLQTISASDRAAACARNRCDNLTERTE